MRFRTPELFLGAFLAAAIFAMGMLFAASYQSNPSNYNPAKHSEAAAQNENTGPSSSPDRSNSSQHHEQQETKSEFWSAKLSDWALVAFTGLLVLFTYRLWKSTDKLWSAGETQIGIANRALMATHRPKIGIRSLEFNLTWQRNQLAEAEFIIVNKGASRAYIKESNGILFFRHPGAFQLYAFDTYEGQIEGCPSILLEGASVKVKIRSTDTGETADQRFQGQWYIYAAGRIIYEDETGTPRTTAFLRQFRPQDMFFTTIKDPEYEYED